MHGTLVVVVELVLVELELERELVEVELVELVLVELCVREVPSGCGSYPRSPTRPGRLQCCLR